MRTRRWLAGAPLTPLAVLFGLNAVDEFDSAAFSVLTPEIKAEFGLSIAGVATIAAAVIPLAVLLQLGIAYVADRRRRTWIAAAGALVWAGFSAATAVAASVVALTLTRVGSALGKSANATHESLLADWYAPATRGRVYAVHSTATPFGLMVGPLLAGVMADRAGWRLPFVALALPTVVVAIAAARLHEPIRGETDRLAAGADAQAAAIAEDPPGLAETFRALARLRTARWIYASLAFTTAGALGTGSFISLFFEEEFAVGPAGRGAIAAATQPVAIAALILAAITAQRWTRRPATTLRAAGALSAGSGLALLVTAVAPTLMVAVGGQVLSALLGALVLPGLLAAASLVVPARMRSVGFATGSVWALLGLAVVPFIGAAGDRWGVRVALAAFVPLLVVGGACMARAARYVDGDAARAAAAGVAAAEERRRRLEGDPHMLVVRNLVVVRGGVTILRNVDLTITDGETLAVLGTNGAGKSTLLDAITGLIPVAEGSVLFDGHDVTDADPARRAALGLVGAPAGRGVFGELTVDDNLAVATEAVRGASPHELRARRATVLELFPELARRLHVAAGDLSGGEQQMLNLAIAFIGGPKLLLIDELTLGLSADAVDRLVVAVQAMQALGTTIVIVEQSPEVARRVAKRAVFVDRGVIRYDGSITGLRRSGVVRAALFPTTRARVRAAASAAVGAPALEVDRVSVQFGGVQALRHVSVAVADGEIVGLVGGNGAGKSTLLDVVCGFVSPSSGAVRLGGVDVSRRPPEARAGLGLARSFQDGRLWPRLPLLDAVMVALDRHHPAADGWRAVVGDPDARAAEDALRERARDVLCSLGIDDHARVPVGALSTGQRRVAELAVATAGCPTIVLLDEPAAGLAHAELPALIELLRDLPARMGCAVLLVEHDRAVVERVCSRIVRLEAGQIDAPALVS